MSAADSELLVFLKARKAAVTVPKHWSSSTKFLSGKRVGEKKPYELPEFIAQTGIGKLRETSDDSKDSIQKRQRERARPKLGRIDIDYQVLHDAFFKHQTKPRLTKHGELYYEGKESERDFSKFNPGGALSEELKRALGLPETSGAYPPPWLFYMQRFGPPPSYTSYLFPGVNAPIPEGAQYGMHAGGWGKPPLDAFGKGLYGDVMGVGADELVLDKIPPVSLWGGFTVEESEDEEEDERRREDSEESEDEVDSERQQTARKRAKFEREAPATTVLRPAAVQPDEEMAETGSLKIIDLRKKPIPSSAHRVLEKQDVSVSGSQLYGGSHRYAGAGAAASTEVQISIAPEDLKDDASLSQAELAKRYEEERSRTKPAVGLAPGAGTIDVVEMEKQIRKQGGDGGALAASKTASTSGVATNPAKKKKFKF